MSSRLKKKVERDNLDNDTNLLESFVTYGTPLPSLDKKDANEFVPVWQQTVTDEKGRRRFHGAFTGGFSAGYWNTVGSKEGWTPQTFVSSRANRASHAQRAQDFMDEEDLADQRASQTIKTNEQYDPLMQGPRAIPGEGGNKLVDMIRAGTSRIGEQLMAKMGWKSGQGVGPRLSWKARRRQAQELGLALEQEDDPEAQKHLYAPLDRPLAIYPAKENQQGLGYTQQHSSLHQPIASSSRPATRDSSRRPVGGAFGIGALEDADEDDAIMYEDGPTSNRSDQQLMELDEEDSASWPQITSRKFSKPFVQKAASANVNVRKEFYNDGTPVLPGFKLASETNAPDQWYAPPDIPKNFKPNPQRIFDLSPLHASSPSNEIASGGRHSNLSADSRGRLLGEEQIKAPPRSVFDYISKKNQERLNSLTGASKPPLPSSSSTTIQLQPQSVSLAVPHLDPTTAQAALKGFQPFGDDKNKQARYRFYLEAQAGLKSSEGVFAPSATPDRVDELNKELVDFQKAAMVFKPMSFAMSSRFTSGSSEQTAKDMQSPTQPGLRFIDPSKLELQPKALDITEKREEILSPAVIAVRADMFGQLTRTVKNFYPNKLLCKRFNVRNPYPEGPSQVAEEEDEGPANELLNKETMESLRAEGGLPQQSQSTSKQKEPREAARQPAAVGLGEDETQGRDTLTYEKPSMDLFKAIFADESDESDEEGKEQPKENLPGEGIQRQQPVVEEHNIIASSAPQTASAPASFLSGQKEEGLSTYEPKAESHGLTPISFSDFKPVFVSKFDRTTKLNSVKTKKDNKTAPLSFEVDDGDMMAPVMKEKRKKPKGKDRERKKHKSQHPAVVEEVDEWVEKAPAAIPAPMRIVQGRAKASDFL